MFRSVCAPRRGSPVDGTWPYADLLLPVPLASPQEIGPKLKQEDSTKGTQAASGCMSTRHLMCECNAAEQLHPSAETRCVNHRSRVQDCEHLACPHRPLRQQSGRVRLPRVKSNLARQSNHQARTECRLRLGESRPL